MARKGTGLAVAVGAAIAIGAVVAFASGKRRKDDEEAEAEAEDQAEEAEPSPVSPTGVVPPFVPGAVPPIQISFPGTDTPPIKPPVEPTAPTTPGEVPPVIELPDEDEAESEAESPTVKLPGGLQVEVPKAGTTVTLPGGITATVPSIPGVTAPVETPAAVPPPPTPAVEKPSAVPADTVAIVAQMLADEAGSNWRKKYPALAAWQAARGLVADQMYGVKSAQRMAQEIGTLPIIRYWPKGTTRETALEPYRNAILTLAGSSPEPRRAQLIMSANREQGQAFTAPSSPIRTLVKLAQVA